MKPLFSKLSRIVIVASAVAFAFAGADRPRSVDAAASTAPVGNQQLVVAIQVLQSVKRTLEAADHDYGGHKGAAIRDVGKAEKQLREALGAPVNGRRAPVPHLREPQIFSDYQLAECIPVLAETITFLSQSPTDFGGHRARAIADSRAAIAQLELALEYSAVHNWGGDYRIFARREVVIVATKHSATKHQQLVAVHKTQPLHHRLTLSGTNASARKQRIQQRQAYAQLKGPTNNGLTKTTTQNTQLKAPTSTHVFVQNAPHLPPHSVAAKIHAIAMRPPLRR